MARLIYSMIMSLDGYVALAPVVVGGGNRALPDGVRLDVELLDERRFGNGMVHLRYLVSRS
ncbi:MAG TPA: hypothetical protein VG455_03130 [Acidimicrobiales bacterium]|nr:hypothetical protein [Acidimicrobiales bacterium]